jgi:AcrR family transcriptional regulator
MPRPRSLTNADIATAALAVIDRDGLAGLSMRAVADELGVATMGLYRYVDSRDQLEALVIELVLDGVDPSVPRRTGWRNRVSTLVGRVRENIDAHPAVVPLLLTRRHASLGTLRWGEAVLDALAAGGFDGKRRAIAFRTVLSYLFGSVQVSHFGPLSGVGTEALAALPAADFPRLAETAPVALAIGAEEEFTGGLAVVLRGLEAEAAPGTTRAVSKRPRA